MNGRSHLPRWLFSFALAALILATSLQATQQAASQTPRPSATSALPADATGADIYQAACETCHGTDGRGSPQSVVGFDTALPDFTDCTFGTAEADLDWTAVVTVGGPVRGLSRRMPAFGEALSPRDIELVVGHLRTFCADRASWPQGDLNFPRAFFTEKAFPENESVWTSTFSTQGPRAVENALVYERRIGSRNQIEAVIPVSFLGQSGAPTSRGLGDVAFAFKRAFYSNMTHGVIAAAGGEIILPTGKEELGLGSGTTTLETFAMFGKALPRNSFLQLHGGFEGPTDSTKGSKEAYLRTALGTTIAQQGGLGRAWSPQVEVLWARPVGGSSEWDIVPQLQVSLSKLQHVLISAGVRIPLNERSERKPQLLTYFLWDWFDGSLFDFWK